MTRQTYTSEDVERAANIAVKIAAKLATLPRGLQENVAAVLDGYILAARYNTATPDEVRT